MDKFRKKNDEYLKNYMIEYQKKELAAQSETVEKSLKTNYESEQTLPVFGPANRKSPTPEPAETSQQKGAIPTLKKAKTNITSVSTSASQEVQKDASVTNKQTTQSAVSIVADSKLKQMELAKKNKSIGSSEAQNSKAKSLEHAKDGKSTETSKSK